MFCPRASAGLTVCEEEFFDHTEFLWVEYMSTSGGLGCQDSNTRMTYYGMAGLPALVWDGSVPFDGGGTEEDAEGHTFRNATNDRLAVDSPLAVTVTSFDFLGTDPYITVKVQIYEELPTTANTYLRVGICENGLSYGGNDYHNVLRDMPNDTPLTVSQVGEIQEVTLPLSISSEWDVSELWAFAIVQRDSDKMIYNAGSTHYTQYALRAWTDGPLSTYIDGTHTFDTTAITHTGAEPTHTVDISLDTSALPEGWDAYFTLDGADLTSATVELTPYESANLNVTIVPGDSAYSGRALMTVHSHTGELEDQVIPFVGIRPGADVLIVGGDGNGSYGDDYYGTAVEAAGHSYALWDWTGTAIDAATMQDYSAVIWYSGDEMPIIRENDRNEIQDYLDGGGSLLLSGQDLAAGIALQGGSSWMINTLRAFYQSSGYSSPLVEGEAGDPVSDGFLLDLQGGDGAGNYVNPDVVTAFSGSESIFTYLGTDRSAGLRAEYSGYKHIFLGFGFESINSAADREALMDSCLDWLIDPASPVGSGLPQVTVLNQNLPNPFNPKTTISFDLPNPMAVSLRVYDLSGRLVDVLLNNEMGQQGRNEVVWKGEDSTGSALPSGTYFYRLEGLNVDATKRMTLLK